VTLLQQTLVRAAGVVPQERIAVVVAEQHRRWWQRTQSSIPNGHTITQPANRGTANGILLAALSIATHDPLARLVFLPSDHYIEDESLLTAALQAAAHWSGPRARIYCAALDAAATCAPLR
jgi:mannose-1-phosphate guanylyltransferase